MHRPRSPIRFGTEYCNCCIRDDTQYILSWCFSEQVLSFLSPRPSLVSALHERERIRRDIQVYSVWNRLPGSVTDLVR